ncbi:MAG TPA: WD40 repeat domain-containing protein [Micromonosporaceae bacterium]|nr:WD40 repeat domain-containing protein [Micromonosporaceae bacterium]
MADRVARIAVGLYPREWRQRYAEEVLDVLDQHRVRGRTVLNLVVHAVAARFDPAYRQQRSETSIRARTFLLGAAAFVAILAVAFGGYALTFREPTGFGVAGAHDLAYTGDGRLLATTSGAQTVVLWDVADPVHPTVVSTVDGSGAAAIAFSPDGHTLATANRSGHTTLWTVNDPSHPAITTTVEADITNGAFSGVSENPVALAFGSDGSTLLVVLGNELATAWNVGDLDHVSYLGDRTRTGAGPGQFRISPDARTVVSAASGQETITIWAVR